MRVCGGGGEGGVRGCQAVSRAAAAAGRSPREKEVRARPSDGSAGRGRRRRTLHSHRELRAAAAGRHTLARPARPGSAAPRRRRGMHSSPPPRALALRPASLQVTLAAGGKLRRESSVWMGASRRWPRLCLHWATPRNRGGVVGVAGSGRCAEKGGDPEPQTQPRRRPGTG